MYSKNKHVDNFIRCYNCRKLLGKNLNGNIEIKCNGCKEYNKFES